MVAKIACYPPHFFNLETSVFSRRGLITMKKKRCYLGNFKTIWGLDGISRYHLNICSNFILPSENDSCANYPVHQLSSTRMDCNISLISSVNNRNSCGIGEGIEKAIKLTDIKVILRGMQELSEGWKSCVQMCFERLLAF